MRIIIPDYTAFDRPHGCQFTKYEEIVAINAACEPFRREIERLNECLLRQTKLNTDVLKENEKLQARAARLERCNKSLDQALDRQVARLEELEKDYELLRNQLKSTRIERDEMSKIIGSRDRG